MKRSYAKRRTEWAWYFWSEELEKITEADILAFYEQLAPGKLVFETKSNPWDDVKKWVIAYERKSQTSRQSPPPLGRGPVC